MRADLVLLAGGLGDLSGELWVLVCCGCYNMDFGRGLGLGWVGLGLGWLDCLG